MFSSSLHPSGLPRVSLLFAAVLAALLLSACGGPPQATPTAIPAGIVRPVQPTPQYPGGSDVFSLLTPQASPRFAQTPVEATPVGGSGSMRAAAQLFMKSQTPSAVGISPGGTAIYAERGGRALASVPVGGILTVTGKSADGAWYAVYNDAAVFGWTPAGQLRVYGGDDLIVVEEAPDPAPVATLLAQAAEPVLVLDDLMVQLDAAAMAAAQTPTAQPTPEPSVPAAAGPRPDLAPPAEAGSAPATGVVSSAGRLNLRAEPDTGAAIVQKLEPGVQVTILERTADGAWLQVQLEDGLGGWVAAEFVTLDR